MALAPINGVEIYYEEHGQGTPILFCHEFAGDHRAWDGAEYAAQMAAWKNEIEREFAARHGG